METEESTVPAEEFHQFLALPDHIQIEIMQFLDLKTRLKLSTTCSHLNMLMWSSPKLFKGIRLNIRICGSGQQFIEVLEVIQANQGMGRKYTKVKLYNYSCLLDSDVQAALMETMALLGRSVNDLAIAMNDTSNKDLESFLRNFPGVEKLTLDGFMGASLKRDDERVLNTQGLLPRLKCLNVDFPFSSILDVVKHVNTLEHFTFQCYEADRGQNFLDFGFMNFEDFVIKQNRLKELKIYGMQLTPMFEINRTDEISFQLETLHAVCFFVHRNNVENFFKTQRNIKNLHLINFFEPSIFTHDRPNYSNILHGIFSLPKLETITIGHGETVIPADFDYLSDIQNKSVKELEYWGRDSKVIESFVNIFPHIKKVNFEAKDVRFANLPCEKLEFISVDKLMKFSFTPPVVNDDETEKFEESVIEFLKRHRNVRELTIGHKDWIGTSFGLSLKFLKQILKILKNLRSIEVYNPLDLEESLKLLNEIHSHKLHI